MTSFDLIVLAVIIVSVGFAIIRGALREIGTLAALGLAALAAFYLLKPLQGVLGLSQSFVSTAVLAGSLGLVSFVGLYALLHLGLARATLSPSAVRYDRIAGGVFGFARGLVLVGLGFLAYSYYLGEDRRPASVNAALTLPVAKGVAGFFEGFAPEETRPAEEDLPDAPPLDPAVEGYARGDRSALSEIMTTVTTGGVENDEQQQTGAAATPDRAARDPIADMILRESAPE